jgi:hypothetical protein
LRQKRRRVFTDLRMLFVRKNQGNRQTILFSIRLTC